MDEALRTTMMQFDTSSRKRALSTPHIVFLVVAAAAPMAAMVGNIPIALSRGNGGGLPGAFLVACLTLLMFAIGYAAMSKRVVNSGAFYTFIALGLGKHAGVASAYLAIVAYNAFTVGMAAAVGYFTSIVAADAGMHVPWWMFSIGAATITAILGYRSIDFSSKFLGLLMIAEIGILAYFDLSVLMNKGMVALPATSFQPGLVFSPGFAISLMFAYTAFAGFESAALYGEEAADPARSIPRATLISVLLIGAFYLATSWVTVGAIGIDAARATATEKGGDLLFTLIVQYCGSTTAALAGLLLCTSFLASYLAIHNAAARYMFSLGREGLLPKALGRFNPRRYAPSNASLTATVLTVVALAMFFIAGGDPYMTVMPSLTGLASVGIILLQALASLAIVMYFRRIAGENPWQTLIAPAIGALGLAVAAVLVMMNYSLLTGVESGLINGLPLIYPLIAVAGIAMAQWLKNERPTVFAGIASVDLRAVGTRSAPPVRNYRDKYCIVGAGPCGLLTARAFRLEGIPYDQFERHADVGGIWDIDNPGTPMYESAHFISSKFTSNFYGFPMPDHYPDYPGHRDLLHYIRNFAEAYGLRKRITFGVGVEHAEPVGENAAGGWSVLLTNGELRHYKGIVCANGVTWHPNLPDYPGLADFKGEVRHTNSHRSPTELKGRRVLIVGCGNSGADIACDAARNAEEAFLSVRRGYRFVPKHMFGVPTDVFIGGHVKPPKGVVVPDDPTDMIDALVGDLTRLGLPKPDHKALESHPIMNSQLLHHLAHGDLSARPDIARFTATGAVFLDGSEETFDLVLFATGYNYKIPYLDEDIFTWKQGHPQLYLNIFHRKLKGLTVVGFAEFADAGFQRFDEMAQMVAMDAFLEASEGGNETWTAMKREHHPNLRGAMHYIDTPRHANYVDARTYKRVLAEIRAQFGWVDPNASTYDGLREEVPATAAQEVAEALAA